MGGRATHDQVRTQNEEILKARRQRNTNSGIPVTVQLQEEAAEAWTSDQSNTKAYAGCLSAHTQHEKKQQSQSTRARGKATRRVKVAGDGGQRQINR